MRAFGRRLSSVKVNSGSDEVLQGILLPQGSTLHGVKGTQHWIAFAAHSVQVASMYSSLGYILPVQSPSTALSYNTLWDELVPKDQDISSGAFDLTTGVQVDTPVEEPGEVNLDAIMGMQAVTLEKVWERHKLLTFANIPTGYVDAAPDLFLPNDSFSIDIKKSYFVDQPSVLLFGGSAPTFDDVATALPATPPDPKIWNQLQYVERTLDQMMDFLLGLTSEGTGTHPFDEAATAIANWLEPNVFEETPASFGSTSWIVFTQLTADVSFMGDRKLRSLSSRG